MAGALAGSAARSLVAGTDFGDTLLATLPDVIGATIGRMVAEGIGRSGRAALARPLARPALATDEAGPLSARDTAYATLDFGGGRPGVEGYNTWNGGTGATSDSGDIVVTAKRLAAANGFYIPVVEREPATLAANILRRAEYDAAVAATPGAVPDPAVIAAFDYHDRRLTAAAFAGNALADDALAGVGREVAIEYGKQAAFLVVGSITGRLAAPILEPLAGKIADAFFIRAGGGVSRGVAAEGTIPTIGGRVPINSRYAGQVHPSGVGFTEQGFPNFGPYSQAEVEIPNLTSRYGIDSRLANEAMGYSSTPKGYIWHHVEDGTTMQLIPKSVHNSVRHTGGAAVIRNGGFD